MSQRKTPLSLNAIGFSLSLLALALFSSAEAQTYVPDLSGFRIGQFRDVAQKELGPPDKAGPMDGGITYEAFLISDSPVLYMVFQYQQDDPDIIWSIQITGTDEKHDLHFKGLKLGMSPLEVEKILGKPTKTSDVGEHGILWTYDKTNFSVEINPNKKLSSIRIYDNREKEADVKNLPDLQKIAQRLSANSNVDLAEVLSPAIEVYEGDKTVSFGHRMRTEIETDRSSVFATVRRLAKELATVNTRSAEEYETRMRLRHGTHPQHIVILKKNKSVKEIIFDWDGSAWVIWEFGSGAPPEANNVPTDWRSIYSPGTLKDLAMIRIPALIKTPNVLLNRNETDPLAAFSYNSANTNAKVKFTGERRETSAERKSVIGMWLETINKPRSLADRFAYEYKFNEADVDYWIPVQSPIAEKLSKDFKVGDTVQIYLAWVGIHYVGKSPELLAIVNEAEK